MTTIRIAYLLTGLNTGGAELMLFRLLEKQDRKRYKPCVISIVPLGQVAGKIEKLGVPVYSLEMSSKLDLKVVLKLISIFKKINPHILHTQLFHADLLGRVVGYYCKVPVIISSIRNTEIGGKVREKLLRWTDRFTIRTSVVSETSGKRMVEAGVVPAEKLCVIYNGLDVNDYYFLDDKATLKERFNKELNLTDNRPFALSIGRLHEQKGFYYLLEAISILDRKGIDVFFAIAGEGELRSDLEKRIQELGLNDKVNLLGLRNDIPALMGAADLLVQSSLWEGLPGVVLEAMATGLPVIATSVGGTGEVVVEGKTGLLIPPANPDVLADAVEKLLSLPEEKRTAMGEVARKRIEDSFSVNTMVYQYEVLYEQCLKEAKIS